MFPLFVRWGGQASFHFAIANVVGFSALEGDATPRYPRLNSRCREMGSYQSVTTVCPSSIRVRVCGADLWDPCECCSNHGMPGSSFSDAIVTPFNNEETYGLLFHEIPPLLFHESPNKPGNLRQELHGEPAILIHFGGCVYRKPMESHPFRAPPS